MSGLLQKDDSFLDAFVFLESYLNLGMTNRITERIFPQLGSHYD